MRTGSRLTGTMMILLLLCACTEGEEGPSPPLVSPAYGVPSPDVTRCTAGVGGGLLNRFVTDFNAGGNDLVVRYFAGEAVFVRWWDPTMPPGPTIDHAGLAPHLRKLYNDGIRIAPVENYRDAPAEPGGFTFGRVGVSDAGNVKHPLGKGIVDCASSTLKVLVIDQW
jgi:hypothetical protein